MTNKTLRFVSLVFTLFILAGSSVFAGASDSAFKSGFDVSIDRVIANNQVVSQSKNNLLEDDDFFFIQVDVTAVKDIEKGHVEASLRGRQSGDVVADATGTFDIFAGESFSTFLFLVLNDGLKKETDFELTVKIVNARGSSEQKTYGIKTKQTRSRGTLDVSIDKVTLNNHVLAASRNTFVEEEDVFNVVVEFTPREDSEFSHVEAILKDLRSGNVVADSTGTFDLFEDLTSTISLRLELLEDLRKSDAFELTIRVVNADGDLATKTYGIRMEDGASKSSGLDISIDSVEVKDKIVVPDETNFVILGESSKEIDVKVKLTSLENIENARIDAVLMFENGNVVADTTANFNINKDQSVTKDLELSLVSKLTEGNMRLKIRVTDAEGNSMEKVYGLRFSRQKTPFLLSSISLDQGNIQAGKSVGITLNIKNMGVMPIEAVVAKVSIEELGISSTRFVDKITSKASEEFVLRIPENANAGTYTIRAELTSQFSNEKETSQVFVAVNGREQAEAPGNKLKISVPIAVQDLRNDGTEVAYPVTFTNNDAAPHVYTILLESPESLDLRIGDSNTFVLNTKESNTISVYASTRSKVAGEKTFNVVVKENNKVLKIVQLKANVAAESGIIGTGLKTFLMVILIIIAIGLAGAGLYFGLRSYFQRDDSEESAEDSVVQEIPEGEAYY